MEEFNLKRFAKTAWHKKIIIVAIMIVSMVIGLIYSYWIVTPKYKSRVKIVLTKVESSTDNSDDSGTSIAQSDITLNNSLVNTYSDIIKSQTVLNTVIENLGLDITEESLYDDILVESGNTAAILTITVSNEKPEVAKNLTNEIANVFSEQIKEIYGISNVNILDKAQQASKPYNINHQKDLGMFFVCGAVVSIIFVFIIYMLDTTVKQAEDIENIGMQVAGIIPLYEKDAESKMLQNKTKKSKNKSKLLKLNPKKTINKKLKDPELVVLENVKSPITEAFRTLRTNLTFSNDSQAMKNILVTSSNSRDGKSYVSANLATIFSKTNKKVILIDADMRKGRQNKIFKVSNSHGLANCLVDMTPKAKMELSQMDKYIKETNIPNLHIMTSGDRPTNPAELLSSTRILKLLELLDSMYDIVIIDGTPSTIVSDSLAIAKFVDITLVVAAYKTTKMEALKEIDKSFENVGGKIFGVILNKYPISKSTYTESYYYDDNKEKKEHLDVQEVKNKSVADLIDEAIKKAKEKEKVEGIQSIDEQFLYNIENNSNGNYVNNYMELQINNITNELEDIKKIFVKSVNDNQKVDSQDITDIKLEINYMKKMLDLKEALDTSKEIHEEIKNLREMVESLLEEQKENEEKVKTFIHEYRKNVIDKRNKDIY